MGTCKFTRTRSAAACGRSSARQTCSVDRQAKLESKYGIKAQHAVFRALKEYLAQAGTGWDVEETPVGSAQDRQGIDIWLTNKATGDSYMLDISFREKPGNAFVVRIRNDWFVENADGSVSVGKEYINALVRAVLPALRDATVVRRG